MTDLYIRREANDAEKAALRELREHPERYRWCVSGRNGYTVAAMHDALPYITTPVAIAHAYYYDTKPAARKAVARAAVDGHNAALDRAGDAKEGETK